MPRYERRTTDRTPLPFVLVLLLLIALQCATILYMLVRPEPAIAVVERPEPCLAPLLDAETDCLMPIAGRSA